MSTWTEAQPPEGGGSRHRRAAPLRARGVDAVPGREDPEHALWAHLAQLSLTTCHWRSPSG